MISSVYIYKDIYVYMHVNAFFMKQYLIYIPFTADMIDRYDIHDSNVHIICVFDKYDI